VILTLVFDIANNKQRKNEEKGDKIERTRKKQKEGGGGETKEGRQKKGTKDDTDFVKSHSVTLHFIFLRYNNYKPI
jgi:hypothetical protein